VVHGVFAVSVVRDCFDVYSNGLHADGVYTVQVGGNETNATQVYCDMSTDGGPWTVCIRFRFNPSIPKKGWGSGVNRSVTLGDGLTQMGRYPGGRKSPSLVQGRRPNRGSSGQTLKLILRLFWKWM